MYGIQFQTIKKKSEIDSRSVNDELYILSFMEQINYRMKENRG